MEIVGDGVTCSRQTCFILYMSGFEEGLCVEAVAGVTLVDVNLI